MRIHPSGALTGSLTLPGDKAISHRYAILAALAQGTSTIHNYATGADCHSTLGCLKSLGIAIETDGTRVTVHGKGLAGWQEPATALDCGNSGSAMRMLAGPLAAKPFTSCLVGDASLTGRPMRRILEPLTKMGGRVEARENQFPPLTIHGGPLHPIDYTLPVASAQVKTCVLLAGLFAEGETVVREPVRSRDHTEIALREFGADLTVKQRVISLQGRPSLEARDLRVPGDLSSAAFFLVAALLRPGSDLYLRGAGLNPTRSALLDFLLSMGAAIEIVNLDQANGELAGDIHVRYRPVRGGVIEGETAAALIDEIPVLAVLGAASEEGLTVRDAAELRVKETDRIAAVTENLQRLGVTAEARPDGMVIPGRQTFRAAHFDSFGDHRIAMAFAVAALHGDGPSELDGAEAASISFPTFYELLAQATGSDAQA